jgi:hypothetical protein
VVESTCKSASFNAIDGIFKYFNLETKSTVGILLTLDPFYWNNIAMHHPISQ